VTLLRVTLLVAFLSCLNGCSDYFPVRTEVTVSADGEASYRLFSQLREEVGKLSSHCDDEVEGKLRRFECLSRDMPAWVGAFEASGTITAYVETTDSGSLLRDSIPAAQRKGFKLLNEMLKPYSVQSRKLVVRGKEYSIDADFDFTSIPKEY
jgi:hypothetical protein